MTRFAALQMTALPGEGRKTRCGWWKSTPRMREGTRRKGQSTAWHASACPFRLPGGHGWGSVCGDGTRSNTAGLNLTVHTLRSTFTALPSWLRFERMLRGLGAGWEPGDRGYPLVQMYYS